MVSYSLQTRGDYYRLNKKGHISIGDVKPSGDWKVFGVARRWNARPRPWSEVKSELDEGKSVEGYLYDVDHGNVRMWGGLYLGKVPKAKLVRVNSYSRRNGQRVRSHNRRVR